MTPNITKLVPEQLREWIQSIVDETLFESHKGTWGAAEMYERILPPQKTLDKNRKIPIIKTGFTI